MKKNIGFINLDSATLRWLLKEVRSISASGDNAVNSSNPSVHGLPEKEAKMTASSAMELESALTALARGDYSTLMIEIDDDGMGDDNISQAASQTIDGEIRCGSLSIFARSRKVTRDGLEIGLTPKEFDILYFLAQNRGEVFTKEQIYQAVWADDYLLDDSNIMAFIRKLRKKIEPNPDAPQYILTVWGIGYKFTDK